MAENPRIEELRRRVQADPASIAFAALAEEFRRVGRYEEAVSTCRTGLQRHPAYLSARVTLGRALIETGDYAGAREELETVLRSAPENLAAIRGLAQIDERLAHSTELDPHLADIMETHAESLRAAALAAPAAAPPAPAEPAPEPVVALSEPAFERRLTLAPRREFTPEPGSVEDRPAALDVQPASIEMPGAAAPPAAEVKATDPFTAFLAPPEKPAPDVTFDLSAAFETVNAKPAFTEAPPPQPQRIEPFPQRGEDLEIDLDLALVAPAPHEVPGPDPEVLATLARLQRFLGAIESLRA